MDTINKINELFLQANKVTRPKVISTKPVMLVLNNDTLTLFKYGEIVDTIDLQLKDYHIIKSICHYICGHVNGLITDDSLDNQILEFIKANKKLFEFDGIKYWCHLTEICRTKKINHDILACAMKHTAIIYQKELHDLVQRFKATVAYNDWNQIVVIVTGPPSPRPGHSAKQYFSRLTGTSDMFYEPAQDEKINKRHRKLFYVENIYDMDKILDVVGQLLLERTRYDQIVNMKTDILSYDTDEYLKRVCGK